MKHNLMSELLNEFSPPRLIILGGRPHVGKTTVMLNLASEGLKEHNKSVLYFSLAESLNHATENLQNLSSSQKSDLEATVFSSLNLSIEKLANSLKAAASEKVHLKYILVDNLGLVGVKEKNNLLSRKEEYQLILTKLRELSRDLNLTIIISDFTNLNTDPNDKQEPHLNNIRFVGESQLVDDFLLVYRPNHRDQPESNVVKIAHFRNGVLKTRKGYFNTQTNQIDP